jgi:hypothetical protein
MNIFITLHVSVWYSSSPLQQERAYGIRIHTRAKTGHPFRNYTIYIELINYLISIFSAHISKFEHLTRSPFFR